MLKVLLVGETAEGACTLEAALAALDGITIAGALRTPAALPDRIREHRPDVVLIHTDSPSRGVLEQLAAASSAAPRPVVMFTGDGEELTIRAALRAGVSAYVVDGLAPERIGPILRVAIGRFEAEQALRAELVEARARLAERKLVDRAKGILMKHLQLTEAQAFAALRSLAMQRGVRLGEAAQQVIDVASMLG